MQSTIQEIPRRKDLYAILVIFLLAYLAYSNSFHGEFQYDDERLIRFNFALRDLSLWKDILRFEQFRPLTIFTYAINFQISQKNPWSYHLFNFIFHLASIALFYCFIRRMSANVILCFFSAALFAVHPLNTEAVSYIASRPILLCAIFYFSALLCFDTYVRKPNWLALAGFFLSLAFGMLSKEDATLIPVAALLYNHFQYGTGSLKKHFALHAGTLLLILAAFFFRWTSLPQSVSSGSSIYLATETVVWFRYLWLAIFPIPLNVDHDIPAIHFSQWNCYLAILGVLVMMILLYQIKEKRRWVSFFGFWFFLNLMASSSIVPLNDFLSEHRAYLSMFGFAACVAYLTQIKKDGSRLVIASLVLLALFYSAVTWKRNLAWQSKMTLWADAVEKSPQKFRPHLNLAFALFQRDAYPEAMQEYLLARSMNPAEPRIHTGLGFTFLEMRQLQPAELSFQTALKLDPQYIDAKTGLGILHYKKGEYEKAIPYFVQSFPQRKESSELVAMMSESYLKMHQFPQAVEILIGASTWDIRFREILDLVKGGDYEKAVTKLQTIGAQK
jgi:hypothetical protein